MNDAWSLQVMYLQFTVSRPVKSLISACSIFIPSNSLVLSKSAWRGGQAAIVGQGKNIWPNVEIGESEFIIHPFVL